MISVEPTDPEYIQRCDACREHRAILEVLIGSQLPMASSIVLCQGCATELEVTIRKARGLQDQGPENGDNVNLTRNHAD